MSHIFATGATTSFNAATGRVEVIELTHATVARIKRGPTDGIEIVNRAGVTMFLDIDAAQQLAFLLPKVCAE
jgi:hypothetical protein